MKTCTKCGKQKSISKFYSKYNRKQNKSFVCSICTTCEQLRHKDWYEANRSRVQSYSRSYYKENRKSILLTLKNYREENRVEFRKKSLAQHKKLYKSSASYRIACLLRGRVFQVLKGHSKSAKTLKLLGCSVEHLRQQFESQFTEGMCWSKFMNGDIHIDHIRPCSSFDLSRESEQQKCFHYSNLQPLWAEDNLKKGKSIEEAVV